MNRDLHQTYQTVRCIFAKRCILSTVSVVLLILATPSGLLAQDSNGSSFRPAELFEATREYQGPDFELYNLTGDAPEKVRLSHFDGKVIVLNFWATWCPPCREEVPSLIKLQERFADQEIQVIGVALDEDDAENKVRAFANAMQINYPVPIDDGSVVEQYGPLGVIPTTFIMDRKRNIRYYAPGYLLYEQLEEAVQVLLDEL